MNHILLDCAFARQVGHRVLSLPGWSDLTPASRVCLPEHLHKGFDSLVLLFSWQLWKERNSRVFDCSLSSVSVVLGSILQEGHLWSTAGVASFEDMLGV